MPPPATRNIAVVNSDRLVPTPEGFAQTVRDTVIGTLPTVDNTPVNAADTVSEGFAKVAEQLITIEREYLICRPLAEDGIDLTNSFNGIIQQLDESGAKGGEVVFPKGNFTGDGNFNLVAGRYKGMGKDAQSGISGEEMTSPEGTGTRLTMNKFLHGTETLNPHNNFFNIGAHDPAGGASLTPQSRRDIIVEDMMINLSARLSAHGILLTNPTGYTIAQCEFSGLYFKYGNAALGLGRAIIAYSYGGGSFEGILNKIKRSDFIGPVSSFYCNGINSGWDIDTNFSDQAPGTVTIDLLSIGNIAIKHWLAGSSVTPVAANAMIPTNNAVFLRTTNAWNNITVDDLQSEGLQYAYQHGSSTVANNFPRKSVTFRNSLIQGQIKSWASNTFVSENNFFVNHVTQPTFLDTNGGIVGGWCQLHLIGKNNVETRNNAGFPTSDPLPYGDAGVNRLTQFTNPYSRVIDYRGNINKPVVVATPGETQIVNASSGEIKATSGTTFTVVFNVLIDANSIVIAQMMGADGSIAVRNVTYGDEFFVINYTGTLSATRAVKFWVVKCKEIDSNYGAYLRENVLTKP